MHWVGCLDYFQKIGRLSILNQRSFDNFVSEKCQALQSPCVLGIFRLGFLPEFEPDKFLTLSVLDLTKCGHYPY